MTVERLVFAVQYETIDPMSREDVDAALARALPKELRHVVLAVALHSDDATWASSVCVQLAQHESPNVRGNAIRGLGHLARRSRRLENSALVAIRAGLQDEDGYVQGQAESAMDDVRHFSQ
jgi:hypothetical protein